MAANAPLPHTGHEGVLRGAVDVWRPLQDGRHGKDLAGGHLLVVQLDGPQQLIRSHVQARTHVCERRGGGEVEEGWGGGSGWPIPSESMCEAFDKHWARRMENGRNLREFEEKLAAELPGPIPPLPQQPAAATETAMSHCGSA